MVNLTREAITEAERAVVGAALIDPETIRVVLDHCTPADFADPILAGVYDLMIGHRSARLGVDEVTIAAAAAERGLRGVDRMFLFNLRESTPTASNAGFYAARVHEGGVRRNLRSAGTRMAQLADSDEPLSDTMNHARSLWESVQSATGGHMEAKPLGEVLEGDDSYDWLIPNLLERRDRVIITGGEGAGKTTLVRQIGIMAAAGLHPTLTTPIAPIRVLVVDAENTETQWRRATRSTVLKARMTGSADPGQGLHLACTPRIDITRDKDLGAIHRLVDEHAPDLLMIGPIYKLVPRAINNDDDAAPVITALDTLRDRGLSLVMEAHAGHALDAGGNRNLRPRGSAALLGWPEFGFGIAADGPNDPNLFNLIRWRGDRDERAWPKTLQRGGTWNWQDANPAATRALIRTINARSM